MSKRAAAKITQPDPAVGALLRGLVEDIDLLAVELIELGDWLSGDGAVPSPERSRRLQSFDLLSQRISASARLLEGLEQALAGANVSLPALVAGVPFHDVRQRFYACLQVPAQPERAVPGTADEVDWF